MDTYYDADLTCAKVYSWLSSHADGHGIVTAKGEDIAQTLHQPLDMVGWAVGRLEALGKVCFVQWRPSTVVIVREMADPVCSDQWSFVKTGSNPIAHTCEEGIPAEPCCACYWAERHSDLIEWRRALIAPRVLII
ncbi:MAG: hypothetical protein WBQ08_12570 [Candidatus Sulfotelmatobacter sp.]